MKKGKWFPLMHLHTTYNRSWTIALDSSFQKDTKIGLQNQGQVALFSSALVLRIEGFMNIMKTNDIKVDKDISK